MKNAQHKKIDSLLALANQCGITLTPEETTLLEAKKTDALMEEVVLEVYKATGLRLPDYVPLSRHLQCVYARLLFVAISREKKIPVPLVARWLARSESSIFRLIKRYPEEKKYNPEFRKLVESGK